MQGTTMRADLESKRSLRFTALLALVLAFVPERSDAQVADGATTRGAASESPSSGTYTHFAVAADHPLASEAGLAVLRAGGNAADAGVATALALGVVSPASSGLGGGGFALYYRASDRSLTFIDFREEAPSAATPDMFARREGDDDATAANRSRTGGLAVGVPGEPAGLEEILTRFGSDHVSRVEIASHAARYARDGYPMGAYVSRMSSYVASSLRSDPVYGPYLPAATGEAPAPGTRSAGEGIPVGTLVRNPGLADAIETFGRSGARDFYRGAIAREIVRVVRANGGIMTAADLRAYSAQVREPLRGTAFGYEIVTAPPPSAGGVTILSSLSFLSTAFPDGLPPADAPSFRHALAASWYGAYLDREATLGDPDHVSVPVAALLDPARAAERASRLMPWHARSSDDFVLPIVPEPAVTPGGDDGTSHFCVVDGEGNVLAMTTTVNLLFGARLTAHGIVLNDQMDDFAREVGASNAFSLVGGAPNLPGPGRRPVSSMAPTIVLRDGVPVMVAGASGGSRIPTATEQVILFSLIYGEHAGAAIAHPRIHHQAHPDELSFERGMSPALVFGLAMRGHVLREVDGSANAQAIVIRRAEDGSVALEAGCDARKDGEPRGE
jgi:gamma-glutamyltranspeptidase/glutathione hydrolase